MPTSPTTHPPPTRHNAGPRPTDLARRLVTLAPAVLLGLGSALLAIEPAVWLGRTWLDPAWQSDGAWIFAALAAVVAWSLRSPRVTGETAGRWPLAVLVVSASTRLLGQVLAIHVLGAMTLVIDVFALGHLLGLPARRRALSPTWLAVAFAFVLPLERLLQRAVGFGLQQVSASGACTLLGLWSPQTHCEGVRILVEGHDVLVDLPCSGARALLALLLLFAVLAAVLRPGAWRAATGLAVTVLAAVGANIVRISALAIGLARADALQLDVMAAPWHDAIGYAAALLGALPLLAWAATTRSAAPTAPEAAATATPSAPAPRRSGRALLGAAVVALCAGLAFVLPARPIDVARTCEAPSLPMSIDGAPLRPVALTEAETDYFARYGGGAARGTYGDYGLLAVQTTAPLRHLHTPDACLAGIGHDVHHVGVRHGTLPSAIYRSQAPDGAVYRVALTFASDRGQLATSVSEVVWLWMDDRDTRWTAVQRIAPWDRSLEELDRFDVGVAAALDLPLTPQGATP